MNFFTQLKPFLVLLICCSISMIGISQTVYVNHAASGSNDGTSWENAYTDLSEALGSAQTGQKIWVATGTYSPGGASPVDTSSFFLQSGVEIFGGFAGTESMLSQRDITANPTILSGDVNGDDIDGELHTNKSDNVLHVLFADENVDNTAAVDGFTISHGYTDTVNTVSFDHWRGGGLHSRGAPQIRNCIFTKHFARFGSSIYVIGGTGMRISNCQFDDNYAQASCAGFLGLFVNDLEINDSEFKNGTASWGTGLYVFNSATRVYNTSFIDNASSNAGAIYCDGQDSLGTFMLIDGCHFEGNSANDFGGGAVYNWNENLVLNNFTFNNNNGSNAAAIYNDGRLGGRTIVIDSCQFTDNTAVDWVGAIYNWASNIELTNSEFSGNKASNTAGAVFTGGGGTAVYNNCSFTGNQAEFGWGGGLVNYENMANITNCEFKNNSCANGGGAMSSGFGAIVSVKNSTLEDNEAGYGGGMFSQNDLTNITIDSCSFLNNKSETNGGGLYAVESANVAIDHSYFEGNTSDFGGAISFVDDTLKMANLAIRNTDFQVNIAQNQGGALNLSNTACQISSSVFYTNLASGAGNGGAISNNVSDSVSTTVSIINTTFAGNIGTLAAGISQFTSNGGIASMTLQNNIFDNPDGLNYAIEAGTPTVISYGGNLSSDNTMSGDLTHAKDINDTDPLFVDATLGDLALTENSPCVNSGISANAPTVDILGNARVDSVDMGAYESSFLISSLIEVADNSVLTLFPNPAQNITQMQLDNEWKGNLQIRITDLSGKVIHRNLIRKDQHQLQHQLDVSQLNAGVYQLTLTDGRQMVTRSLIKL